MNSITPIEPPKGLPKGVKIAITVIIAAIICLVVFASCTSTNKIKTSEHTTTDSAQLKKKDSAGVSTLDSTKLKKDNVVTLKETDGNYVRETVIEFDTTKPLIATPSTSGTTAADYFPKYVYPVKKVTTKETGTIKTKEQTQASHVDSTNVKKKDSVNKNEVDSTHLQKDTKKKGKVVDRTSYTGLIVGSSLLLLLILLYIYFRKKLKEKFPNMKKFLPLLFLPFLASCAPAYQGGGWFIPAASFLLACWCSYRYYFNKETRGLWFPFICMLVMVLLCIGYIIYASVSK